MSELGDALELLHGAAGRVTMLTATLLVWYDEERGTRAVEAARQRHPRGAIAVSRHVGRGAPPPPSQYEQRILVHYRQPDRHRLHRQANAAAHWPHDVLQVCDGEREWTYVAAERKAWVGPPSQHQHELLRLLDPSWLAAACTLGVAGRSSYGGRPTVELNGRPRPERAALHVAHLLDWGAEELHAVLDAETGLLLSLTSRFDGEPYKVERLTAVIVNQPLDDELFRFTPPAGTRVDDLAAGRHRRPPLRLRLRVLRRRFGHRRVHLSWCEEPPQATWRAQVSGVAGSWLLPSRGRVDQRGSEGGN
jgi:hypothetical protein